MGRHRSRRSAAIAFAVVAGALAPATSEAAVYCVPNLAVDPSCQVADPAVQPMLNAAQGSMGVADTVRIGTGTFNVTNAGYLNVNDDVQIIGAGAGATKLLLTDTNGNKTAMSFTAPAASVLRGLTIEVGANMDPNADSGLVMSGSAVARNVVVQGPDATNAIAVALQGDVVFDDSVVNMDQENSPTNQGVRHLGGSTRVTDSTIIADTGVESISNSGGSVTVERSTLAPRFGLVNQGALDPVHAKNVVIDLNEVDGARGIVSENGNEGTTPMTVTGDHLTIVGGGSGSIGARSVGNSNGGSGPFGGLPDDTVNHGEFGDVTLTNSVISGPETSVYVGTDRGEEARAVLSYVSLGTAPVEDDDISDGNASGNATITQSNVTTGVQPGFVNPAAGDYHLLISSPLVNAGDPAPPAIGETDRDGNPRAVSSPGCTLPPTPRRDIGAYEFQAFPIPPCPPPPPDPQTQQQPLQPAQIPSTAKCKTKKRKKGRAAAKKCRKPKKKKSAK